MRLVMNIQVSSVSTISTNKSHNNRVFFSYGTFAVGSPEL